MRVHGNQLTRNDTATNFLGPACHCVCRSGHVRRRSTAKSRRTGMTETAANLAPSRRRTFARRVSSWAVAILITLVGVELVMRIYAALAVGPSVFFYCLKG